MGFISGDAYAQVSGGTLAIASGEITISNSLHTITTETGASDDLATINISVAGLPTGSLPFLTLVVETGKTITFKNGTGNIVTNSGSDFIVTAGKNVLLFYNGTNFTDYGTSSTATPSILTTKGDLWGYDTGDARVTVGANDLPLVADSGQALGLAYKVLPIAGGGTGQTTQVAAFDALAPTPVRGGLITVDATPDYVALAVGAANEIPVSDGTDFAWSGALGRLAFVEEKTFVAAATTTTFAGLTGTDRYVLEIAMVNGAVATALYDIRINGDGSSADYLTQNLLGRAGAASAALVINTSTIMAATTSGVAFGPVNIQLAGGYMHAVSTQCWWQAADVGDVTIWSAMKNSTVASISAIEIVSSVASGIGIGSIIRLYKVIT